MSQISGRGSAVYAACDQSDDGAFVKATSTARPQQLSRASAVTAMHISNRGGIGSGEEEETVIRDPHKSFRSGKKSSAGGKHELSAEGSSPASKRSSRRSRHDEPLSRERTAMMDIIENQRFVEQERDYSDSGYDGQDLCSEDERDVEMLQKKRLRRERHKLSAEQLQQRLNGAATEGEHKALATELKRRRRVSQILKVFGGPFSSSKATRKALDAAGWGRR